MTLKSTEMETIYDLGSANIMLGCANLCRSVEASLLVFSPTQLASSRADFSSDQFKESRNQGFSDEVALLESAAQLFSDRNLGVSGIHFAAAKIYAEVEDD